MLRQVKWHQFAFSQMLQCEVSTPPIFVVTWPDVFLSAKMLENVKHIVFKLSWLHIYFLCLVNCVTPYFLLSRLPGN